MIKNTGPLIQMDNGVMLDGLRSDMSPAYRRRVPRASQAGLAATTREIQNYKPHMNEVVDALVNRIGLEIFRRNSWTNPMGVFKSGQMEFGDTIEEIQVGLLKAHSYNSDRDSSMDDLYASELPDVKSSFHQVNRQEYYKVTITEVMLKRAFLTTNGLSDMVSKLIDSVTTSDNLDEFLKMVELFKLYDQNGGFYRINIPDVAISTSDEKAAKAALRSIRATTANLEFIDPKYNAARMEVAVDVEDLVLFVTPEFRAAADVNALAAAFNIEYAKTVERIINIPQRYMPADDVQAILTTSDFFVVTDTVFETATLPNPAKLSYNYFMHHHSIISASLFAPAIAFTTGPGTEDSIVPDPVTGITAITLDGEAVIATTAVDRGVKYQLESHGTTAAGAETAVRWTVEGESTYQTFITAEGVLHVSGIEEGVPTLDELGAPVDPAEYRITVRATTVDVNPANPAEAPKTVTASVLVTGPTLEKWPVPPAV